MTKRAKDVVVGDIISPRYSFKPQIINVETVEHTKRGKVVINRGKGWRGGEEVFEGEQWVVVCQKPLDLCEKCATIQAANKTAS